MRIMREGEASKVGLIELCEWLPPNLLMVEVGSFSGESAQIFLNSKKVLKLFCVDIWKYADGLDYAESEKEFDRKFSGSPLVVKMKCESQAGCSHFEDGSLDFVYIDASHGYQCISRDIRLWTPKIKPGGHIGGHDFSFKFPGVIQAVGEAFKKPRHVFWDGSWIVKI